MQLVLVKYRHKIISVTQVNHFTYPYLECIFLKFRPPLVLGHTHQRQSLLSGHSHKDQPLYQATPTKTNHFTYPYLECIFLKFNTIKPPILQ
jgi:hypothetical protein